MVVYSSPVASFVFFYLPSSTPSCSSSSSIKLPRAKITPFCCADLRYDNSSPARVNPESPKRSNGEQLAPDSSCFSLSCSCTRRRFAEAAAATALFPICPSNASNLHSDYTVQLSLSTQPCDLFPKCYASNTSKRQCLSYPTSDLPVWVENYYVSLGI